MSLLKCEEHDAMFREVPDTRYGALPFNVFHNSFYNQVIHLHWHPETELVFFVRGHAKCFLGNETFIAMPGDIVFVNSGQMHTAFSIDNTMVEYYAVVFDADKLLEHGYPFSSPRMRLPCIVRKVGRSYDEIHALVTRIIGEWEEQRVGYDSAIRSCMSLLFLSLARNYPTALPDPSSTALPHAERFQDLFSFVESNFRQSLTVEQASRMMHLSTYHFCRLFKRTTGRTFIEFVNLYRVNEAERLLRETSLSITEIADEVGFCSIGYFDRVFKAFKRVAPSYCRRAMKREGLGIQKG